MGYSAPIVALTAFSEESNVRECMESGMDEFLSKPIRRPALKQVLQKFATIPEEPETPSTTTSIPKHEPEPGQENEPENQNERGQAHERPVAADTGTTGTETTATAATVTPSTTAHTTSTTATAETGREEAKETASMNGGAHHTTATETTTNTNRS